MRSINLFYIALFFIGCLLWGLNNYYSKEVALFYGFAETKETEINFNYPLAVGKILVSPGQSVKKGDLLLDLQRIKSKETLEDQGFKIDELRADEKVWKTENEGKIKLLKLEQSLKLANLDGEIQKLEAQRKFQDDLYKDLKTIEPTTTDHQPISAKIKLLQEERDLIAVSFEEEIGNLENELRLGKSPYQIAINRLNAERDFDRSNQLIDIQLTAPEDGLIGNIHCKEAEHIPAYRTLITFYEPNPTLVKGFVHEDLILQVALQDSFLIRSTKDASISCYGLVTGLGSRIVEIPERLRKMPEVKTYGREVLVSIPSNNHFLQKEKVILEFLNLPASNPKRVKSKPVVELKEIK